jgi:hypothetical protein
MLKLSVSHQVKTNWFKFCKKLLSVNSGALIASSHGNNLETLQVAFDLQTNQRCKSPGFDLDTAVQVG